jgi:hypothetical protein
MHVLCSALSRVRWHALVVGVLGSLGCESRSAGRTTETAAPTDSLTTASSGDPAGAARATLGVVFDPLTIRVGDSVAGLAVQRVDVRRVVVDSTPVGTIAFGGILQLEGRVIPHFDSDARAPDGGVPVCFEANVRSAARMPRWSGDQRRPWFCFTNAEPARRALVPHTSHASGVSDREWRVRIDDFTIHRGLSDEVNSARFVGVDPY